MKIGGMNFQANSGVVGESGMEFSRQVIREIRRLIVFTAILFLCLWKHEVAFALFGGVVHVIFPFILGGAIVFILVFVVGHVLNLAINLLGAYVHTNRLQFVEFFGKFYEGGGRPFNPFNMKTKYVDIKEEN